MQASDIPLKFNHPWAYSAGGAYIRPIPEASQIGIQNGAASITDGFPPNCFIPIAGGGSWPWGQDANGILNQITAWNRWQAAGGRVAWDSTFSAAVGGYPQGAIVASATVLDLEWLCITDNNTTNPDTGGAGWIRRRGINMAVFTASGSWTVPAFVSQASDQVWGAGAGAGGAANTSGAGGGGGGGGYSEGIYTVTPGAVISITVGVGGLGGGPGAADGLNGGSSSFGAFNSATGGLKGHFGNAFGGNGGAGGAGSGGTLNLPGGVGGPGGVLSGGGLTGGFQGSSFMGTGIPGGTGASLIQGLFGQFPGVGGQGGITVNPGETQQGGPGANGLVIVRWTT